MISFLLCLAILIGGYFVYGKIVDNTFGPDDRETPAVRINDGVDYSDWELGVGIITHEWCADGVEHQKDIQT